MLGTGRDTTADRLQVMLHGVGSDMSLQLFVKICLGLKCKGLRLDTVCDPLLFPVLI
jgi:hypothetical protein